MQPTTTAPLTRRASMNPAEIWWSAAASTSRSAASLLQTEMAGGRTQGSVYELFAEMEEKDGHLFSVLQTRINAVLGLPRTIVPATSGDADRRAAAVVDSLIGRVSGFDALLRALLDALCKGFAVVEVVWGYDGDGRLTVTDWIAHRQEFFAFEDNGELLLLSPPFGAGEGSPSRAALDFATTAIGRTILPPQHTLAAHPRKFLVLRHGADARNPYGRGLCQHAYWYYFFKKNNLKFWAVANEKYGAPTVMATHPTSYPAADRDALIELLRELPTESGIVVPETIKVALLEAHRAVTTGVFRELADWCNDEMSKIVLGATLTAGEGRRSGSLALGRVHELVRQDYLEADARALEELLNDTLMRWLTDLNVAGAQAPRITFDARPAEDLEKQSNVDRTLVSLGVPLSLAYFYERYGRPVPDAADERLRYDDANLFGYHIQYGILTVNEVRGRLGLAPVPWGDQRANAQVVALRGGVPEAPAGGGGAIRPDQLVHHTTSDQTLGEGAAERAAEKAAEVEETHR